MKQPQLNWQQGSTLLRYHLASKDTPQGDLQLSLSNEGEGVYDFSLSGTFRNVTLDEAKLSLEKIAEWI